MFKLYLYFMFTALNVAQNLLYELNKDLESIRNLPVITALDVSKYREQVRGVPNLGVLANQYPAYKSIDQSDTRLHSDCILGVYLLANQNYAYILRFVILHAIYIEVLLL